MRISVRALCAASLLAIAPLSPALAQGAATSAPAAFLDEPEKLKPGQWVWAPQEAPQGPLLVYVDLTRQVASVYRNGVRMAVSTVSSGKPGHETPTGVFTILQKDADHHSSTYNNAPMPFTERLTWGGIALHAGGLPGYPSSHGCVHLPLHFAKLLFGIESLGGTVVIAGGHQDPVRRPAAGILEPTVAGANPPPPLAPGQQFSWNPAASHMGPVSIVVSTADQQLVMLRNGIEIGRSRVVIPQAAGTRVLSFAGGQQDHWVEVGAGGPAGAAVEQLRLPPQFDASMRSIIAPGTTLVITPAALTEQSTAVPTTILAATGGPAPKR